MDFFIRKHSYLMYILFFVILANLSASAVWSSGIRERDVTTIPTGSYIGNYIRNDDKYTAVIEIENGRIQSIVIKYNGSPLTEAWAREQAELIKKANSDRVKTVPSPEGRNKKVLKAVELALRAGLKTVK